LKASRGCQNGGWEEKRDESRRDDDLAKNGLAGAARDRQRQKNRERPSVFYFGRGGEGESQECKAACYPAWRRGRRNQSLRRMTLV